MDISGQLKAQMDMARNVHDFNGLDKLRSAAQQDEQGALREAARHFESIFVQMMLKGMRQSNDILADDDNPMNSQQVKFYRDMHDQQLAVEMTSGDGLGLADMIVRQLGGDPNFTPSSVLKPPMHHRIQTSEEVSAVGRTDNGHREAAFADRTEFVTKLLPVAQQIAEQSGIPGEHLIAQAAVETGWGQHMIHAVNGQNSHNLFGIKANRDWQGNKTLIDSVEYSDGQASKSRSAFKAYEDFSASMQDYVNLISASPRYQQALEVAGDAKQYFNALQQAGYATDPNYANKINAVLDSVKSIAAQFGLVR